MRIWNLLITIMLPLFADTTDAIEKIILERRLELAFEGHRFIDLLRWGIVDQVLNAYFIYH